MLLVFKLLFFPKKNEIGFKVLGAYLLLLTLVLSATLLQYHSESFVQIKAYKVAYEMIFYTAITALPPTVFFYIVSVTDSIKKFKTMEKVIPHYGVPIVLLLLNIASYLYIGIEKNPNPTALSIALGIRRYANFAGVIFFSFRC
jgi:hypothetical protein